MQNIRNFAIIAHVDHGKSTLADRFLELTGTVEAGRHEEQMLDRNPISRERGITIKLAPVRMEYRISNLESGKNEKSQILNSRSYILNLIDTPGHVDFSYEVERTLACVEGVILLVDATQGIQAQTVAHTYKALEQDIEIIPVVNKIDSPQADVASTKRQLSEFLGVTHDEIFEVSARTGVGVGQLLQAVIQTVPPPSFTPGVKETEVQAQRALIFDSYYDRHRGVVAFVRVFDGALKKGQRVRLHATGTDFEIDEVGIFTPDLKTKSTLTAGEIGYVVTKLKDIHEVQVGDTIADLKSTTPLPGYRKTNPMVFASVFPTETDDYPKLKDAIEKLTLTDAALQTSPIYSKALGSGFRAGFLGLLHADVVRERLEREFDLSIVLTPPMVEFKSDPASQNLFLEPVAEVVIVTPDRFTGAVMRLCEGSRGRFITMDNKAAVYLKYDIPLAELMRDFFDNLKSVTSGFASLDWTFKEYRQVEAGRLHILINGDIVEEFSEYIVAERSYDRARGVVERLRDLIHRQQYEVKIQASYQGKIIASSRLAPLRKAVTEKLYGGDRTRKDKLLKKQKAGKKHLKSVGRVSISKEAFMKLFKQT